MKALYIRNVVYECFECMNAFYIRKVLYECNERIIYPQCFVRVQ